MTRPIAARAQSINARVLALPWIIAEQLKVAQYIADEFKRYGLEPFGDEKDGKRGYIQEFPLRVAKNLNKNCFMRISSGDPMIFLQRPISLGLLLAVLALCVLVALPAIRSKREEAFQE